MRAPSLLPPGEGGQRSWPDEGLRWQTVAPPSPRPSPRGRGGAAAPDKCDGNPEPLQRLDAHFRGHDRQGDVIADPGPLSPAAFVKSGLQIGEVVARADRPGMVRPAARLENCERTAQERLGSGETVRGLKQPGEIVEVDRDIGMIRAVACLVDCQRAAKERLGLGEAGRGLKQKREIVESGRHLDDPARGWS
jgi:hypothetical protein